MIIAVLGPAGAGKGTLTAALVKGGFGHFEAGGSLREWARANDTELERHLAAGGMAPSDLVLRLLKDKLVQCKGDVILDGYPRNIEQADGMEQLPDFLVLLECPEHVIVERLAHRTICPGCGRIYSKETAVDMCACGAMPLRRADDEPNAIKERLRLYAERTEPVIGHLRSKGVKVIKVDSRSRPEKIEAAVLRAVGRPYEQLNESADKPVRRSRS